MYKENILLVDDREDFIAGSKKAGWNTFLFNNKLIIKQFAEFMILRKFY